MTIIEDRLDDEGGAGRTEHDNLLDDDLFADDGPADDLDDSDDFLA